MTEVIDAPLSRPCVLCGRDRHFWDSDHERTVHDACGSRCALNLATLARNLRDAGALCAAFAQGERVPERCDKPTRFNCALVENAICNNLLPCSFHGDAWRPNTRGVAAPGFGE